MEEPETPQLLLDIAAIEQFAPGEGSPLDKAKRALEDASA